MTRPRPIARRRAGTKGIALIEVLVTVAIITLIGGLTFANMGKRGPALARAEASEIALVLQRARMEAAERGRAVEITWDADSQTLVAGATRHVMRRGVEGPTEAMQITLQPTGQSDGFSLPVSAGGYRIEVTLDWLTGRVGHSS